MQRVVCQADTREPITRLAMNAGLRMNAQFLRRGFKRSTASSTCIDTMRVPGWAKTRARDRQRCGGRGLSCDERYRCGASMDGDTNNRDAGGIVVVALACKHSRRGLARSACLKCTCLRRDTRRRSAVWMGRRARAREWEVGEDTGHRTDAERRRHAILHTEPTPCK